MIDELGRLLEADVRAILDRHEAAGTTDSAEYEAAATKYKRRHLCRPDPWPEPLTRAFSQLNYAIYEHMQGPNEYTITGTEKDYDTTQRLGELACPRCSCAVATTRHDRRRPPGTTAWCPQLN